MAPQGTLHGDMNDSGIRSISPTRSNAWQVQDELDVVKLCAEFGLQSSPEALDMASACKRAMALMATHYAGVVRAYQEENAQLRRELVLKAAEIESMKTGRPSTAVVAAANEALRLNRPGTAAFSPPVPNLPESLPGQIEDNQRARSPSPLRKQPREKDPGVMIDLAQAALIKPPTATSPKPPKEERLASVPMRVSSIPDATKAERPPPSPAKQAGKKFEPSESTTEVEVIQIPPSKTLEEPTQPLFAPAVLVEDVEHHDEEHHEHHHHEHPFTFQEKVANKFLKSPVIAGIYSIIITCSCAMIGAEVQLLVGGEFGNNVSVTLAALDDVFTVLFLLELVMRAVVSGWRQFLPTEKANYLNFVDFFLVLIAVIFDWLVPLVVAIGHFQQDDAIIHVLMAFRVLRVMRLVRLVQGSERFKDVKLLLRGLANSMTVLFWTIVVIFFVTYAFAIVGVVLIAVPLKSLYDASDDPDEKAEMMDMLKMMAGVDRFLYTLIQVLTQDSADLQRTMVKFEEASWIFFYTYWGIAVLVLLNLVTAIIVDNAMTNTKLDEADYVAELEKKRLEELEDLKNLFALMDEDGSGELSYEEFQASSDNPEVSNKWRLLEFQQDEIESLFKLLDDGDGSVSSEEFFDGVLKMKGLAQSKDTFKLLKMTEKFQRRMDSIEEAVRKNAGSRNGSRPHSRGGSRPQSRNGPRPASSGMAGRSENSDPFPLPEDVDELMDGPMATSPKATRQAEDGKAEEDAKTKEKATEKETSHETPHEKLEEPSEEPIDEHPLLHRFAHFFATSELVHWIYSIIIVLSCAMIGAEVQILIAGEFQSKISTWLSAIDDVITVCFLVELLVRIRVGGWKQFLPIRKANLLNFMDLFLVVVAIIFDWIIPIIAAIAGLGKSSTMTDVLMSLRVLRVLRLVRLVNSSEEFKEVKTLLRGLAGSMGVLVWTVVVIFFVAYSFAIVGVVLVAKPLQDLYATMDDPDEMAELAAVLNELAGVDRFLYTLIAVLTEDSNELQRTCMKFDEWTWIYFKGYEAVAKLVLLNLVTAIIVDNAVQNSKADEDELLREIEKKKAAQLLELKSLFELMDEDGSGELSWDEFTSSFENHDVANKWELLGFERAEIEELFYLLDDGDGSVSSEEFFEGVMKMKGPAQSRDVFKLMKTTERLKTFLEITLGGYNASRPTTPSQQGSKDPASLRRTAKA